VSWRRTRVSSAAVPVAAQFCDCTLRHFHILSILIQLLDPLQCVDKFWTRWCSAVYITHKLCWTCTLGNSGRGTMNNICQVLIQLLHMLIMFLHIWQTIAQQDIECVIIYLFLSFFEVTGLCCIDLYTFYTNVCYRRCMLQNVYTVLRATCI